MALLGIIGIGNMGFAMLRGAAQTFPSNQLIFTDVNIERMELVKRETNIQYKETNIDLVQSCKYVVLAVKPQYLNNVLDEIKGYITPEKVIISIVLGYSIDELKRNFSNNIKIVRTMPNTPALINEGMTGICYSKDDFSQEEKKVVTSFFGAFGKYEVIEESLIDAVVCVSGSSPAYVYMFIEALADSAVKYGLPRDKAYRMAAQTVLGSAKMVLETNEHPGKLKDQVCSPGGSTIAGVSALEEFGFRNAIIKAADKCYDKAISIKKKEHE
jgi:pyrroline-5-carboxylate reductase